MGTKRTGQRMVTIRAYILFPFAQEEIIMGPASCVHFLHDLARVEQVRTHKWKADTASFYVY